MFIYIYVCVFSFLPIFLSISLSFLPIESQTRLCVFLHSLTFVLSAL